MTDRDACFVLRRFVRTSAYSALLLVFSNPLSAQAPTEAGIPAAQEGGVVLRLGGGHSDNLLREPTEELSGSYSAIGLTVGVDKESRRLSATVDGDLEYRDYSESVIQNEPVGFLDAAVEIHAVPDRFYWVIEDSYQQGRRDPFGIDNPDNREEINAFSTGPRLDLPLGDRTAFRLENLYGTRRFEELNRLDSDDTTVDVGIFRALSPTAEIGVNVGYRDVEYDVPSYDNKISSAYISYTKELSSGQASVVLGTNETDVGDRTESAPYVDIAWEKDVGTRSQIGLSVSNQYVDYAQGIQFTDAFFLDAERLDGVFLVPDVYEQTNMSVSFGVEQDRMSVSISARLLEDRYQSSLEYDNDSSQLEFTVDRTISSRTQIGLRLSAIKRDFVNVDQDDKDTRAQLWLRRQFSGKLSLSVSVERNSRDGNGAFNGFDESVARLFLAYSPGAGS